MGTKITHTEFINKINKINSNIKIIGEYIDSKTKIKCKCLIDGNEWEANPKDLVQGTGCPLCRNISNHKRFSKSDKTFKKEVSEINPNIEVIGTYQNRRTKIKFKCKKCEYIWEAIPSNILRGAGCPKCAKRVKPNPLDFKNEIETKIDSITLLSDYVDSKTKIKCKCNIHNEVWETLPNNLKKGNKNCSKCLKQKAIEYHSSTHEEFLEKLRKINQNIEIVSKYKTDKEKILCKCKIDGHIWSVRPSSLLSGVGCPHCHSSKGEKKIINFLTENNILFKTQFKFNDCRSKLPLPFDFAIFNNEKLYCLIEYQGEQHYFPVNFSGKGEEWSKNNFVTIQTRDKIKKEYCEKNNLKLIIIPYWINDIDDFLKQNLIAII